MVLVELGDANWVTLVVCVGEPLSVLLCVCDVVSDGVKLTVCDWLYVKPVDIVWVGVGVSDGAQGLDDEL